jgi:hypothetical protein
MFPRGSEANPNAWPPSARYVKPNDPRKAWQTMTQQMTQLVARDEQSSAFAAQLGLIAPLTEERAEPRLKGADRLGGRIPPDIERLALLEPSAIRVELAAAGLM